MRITRVLVISCFCFAVCTVVLTAQSNGPYVPSCSPSALDVHALPPALSSEAQRGHLFVLELQNVGTSKCILSQPSVELLPPSDPYNSLFLASNYSEDGSRNEYLPKQLEVGEWAHLLFAWMSRSAPEVVCNQYSELKLHLADINPNMHVEDRAAIDVRNLWIRSCHSVYVSGYRKGRYSPQSTFSNTWLNWWQPAVATESSFPMQPTASQVLAASPLLELQSPVGRTMLNDFLGLRLKFPHAAANGCAFRLLRKRESSGATVISVQQCATADLAPDKLVPQSLEAGISRLDIRALDMLPQEAGPVEYEVVGTVTSSSSAPFARAQIKLIAHDSTLPAQAPILAPLPPCKTSQLQFASHDPVVSGRLQTLRAYEAVNTSSEACSMAGIPTLRFLDEKGANEPNLPRPCPNCENDLFKARPNGRIDLRSGDAAHFLTEVTSIDTQEDPWMHCQRAATLELTVTTGDKPIILPLDAGVCAAIDISAWRAGTFDGDPQNIRWAKKHDVVYQQPKSPVPSDCDKPDLLVLGRPSMIPSTGAVKWGLSLASPTFVKGEPIPLHLWLDNSSDDPASVMTCGDLDYFKARGFDLYDAYGHRVLRKREAALREKCSKEPNIAAMESGWGCTRNFPIQIPANTCLNGDNYDFTAQLQRDYDLPPGEYSVHVRTGATGSPLDLCSMHEDAPFAVTPGKDLTFDVVQP